MSAQGESLELILERVRAGQGTFVFASRESRFNNAVALKEYLERTGGEASSRKDDDV